MTAHSMEIVGSVVDYAFGIMKCVKRKERREEGTALEDFEVDGENGLGGRESVLCWILLDSENPSAFPSAHSLTCDDTRSSTVQYARREDEPAETRLSIEVKLRAERMTSGRMETREPMR